ncbi:MAG: class II fructose-bisphosphate aldolase, partial [Candidatus Hodarchaeales archaeon]
MVSYRELGLINTSDLFKNAFEGGYAIPGYNFNNMEQLQAIIKACVITESPVILQVSKGAREYVSPTLLRYMAEGAVTHAKELHPDGKQIPICLHLDHGGDFKICKSCIDMGFSSVMFDGSSLQYEENVTISRKIVDYAHSQDDYVCVECELGVLAGIEDEVSAEKSTYTDPEEVIDFVTRTECDSLAISIGTSHGANKFSPEQCSRNEDGKLIPPPLRFDILEEIQKQHPALPIVLHGSSSVPEDLVNMVNEYGGALKDAIGIPENQLRKAASMNVCKINIDSDGRLAVTALIRKTFIEKPMVYDPRTYLAPAREALTQLYIRKNREVLG